MSLIDAATKALPDLDPASILSVRRTSEKPGRDLKVTLTTGTEIYIASADASDEDRTPEFNEAALAHRGGRPTELPEDLESLKKDELVELATRLGVEVPTKATKADIIESITAASTSTEDNADDGDPDAGADG